MLSNIRIQTRDVPLIILATRVLVIIFVFYVHLFSSIHNNMLIKHLIRQSSH